MVTGDGKGLAGRQADNTGGGSGRGKTYRRRMTNRVQGGSDIRRSQGKDRREQEEPGRNQTPAMKVTQGGADGGRSHGGGGARCGDGEPMSQCDEEDPEGQDRTDGSGD